MQNYEDLHIVTKGHYGATLNCVVPLRHTTSHLRHTAKITECDLINGVQRSD
jgi:hypothetical protein